MIRHVVMWKFKPYAEGKTKEENMEIVRDILYALQSVIPEIKKIEIGFDINHTEVSMDLSLLTEFDSPDTLAYYEQHPEHLKVVAYVEKVTETVVLHDCEIR